MPPRRLRSALAIVCATAGTAAPLPAQQKTTSESIQGLLGDSAQYRQVITAFQHAVKTHDPAGVAALVNYPIKVTIKGTKRIIKGPQKFIAKYDSIITPAIAIAVQDERYDDMMVNSRGVMLGRREV